VCEYILLYICCMNYEKYRYIFPPRPKNAVPVTELDYYESRGKYLAQPKGNGSNSVIFLHKDTMLVNNRHNGELTRFNIGDEVRSLYKGNGWMVLNGEYLNKNQNNEFGAFNHKLLLFDILVYNGVYLLGTTFEERINMIYSLYGEETYKDPYLNQISDNIFSVKSFYTDFKTIYDEITPIPLYEGLVMKRINAKLEIGNSELNNHRSQLKCRKRTLNYSF